MIREMYRLIWCGESIYEISIKTGISIINIGNLIR